MTCSQSNACAPAPMGRYPAKLPLFGAAANDSFAQTNEPGAHHLMLMAAMRTGASHVE